MIPLYTSSQVREIDNYAVNKLKYPGILLMENAAIGITEEILEAISEFDESFIGIVCGKGNNGGDGFAVARHLSNAGLKIIVIHQPHVDEFSPDALTNFNILKNISTLNKNVRLLPFSTDNLKKLKNCNVIIDAILGSGISGELKTPYAEIVQYLNTLNSYKVAIDIPTGLDADKGTGELIFKSDLTVTLAAFKAGLFIEKGYAVCEKVVRRNIGISHDYLERQKPSGLLIEPEDAVEALPEKKKDVNKYSNGKVLSIAGSGEYPGAAVITSSAVLYTGAGASILSFPKSKRELLNPMMPEVVVKGYDDDESGYLRIDDVIKIQKWIDWADVLTLGPGLGREEETIGAVEKIIKNNKNKILILDADAIFAVGKLNYKKLKLKNCILTPHHKEFADMMTISVETLEKDVLFNGKEFVKVTGSYLVLKGAPTIIFTPAGEVLINTSGNPGMAKFGSGDALTGIIAGLLAQSRDIRNALIAGVYIHSLSADILASKLQHFSFTASDIISNLQFTIQFLRNSIG